MRDLKAQLASVVSTLDAREHQNGLDQRAATQELVAALEQVSRVSEQNITDIKALQIDTHDVKKAAASMRQQLEELAGIDGHQQSTVQVRSGAQNFNLWQRITTLQSAHSASCPYVWNCSLRFRSDDVQFFIIGM